MRGFTNLRMWLTAAMILLLAACGGESGSGDNDTGKIDTSRGEDTTTETLQDGLAADCAAFMTYLVDTCEIDPVQQVVAQLTCTGMDALFIDSFMGNLIDCLTSKDCDDLAALMALAGDTDVADAGSPGIIEECALSAAVTAEPEAANEAFKDHYCEYAIECDPDITSRVECDALFEIQDLGIFMVLDEPHIGDADDCVNPRPDCSDALEVESCLQEVAGRVSVLLGGVAK